MKQTVALGTPQIPADETLEKHIKQSGITYGPQKLELIQKACRLRGVPELEAQDGKGEDAIAYVKLFDPCGGGTWYVMEWDGAVEAYGWCFLVEWELGYIPLEELSGLRGRLGIGIEVDVWFRPTAVKDIPAIAKGKPW